MKDKQQHSESSESKTAALQQRFPNLPEGYLEHLRTFGAGVAPSGCMIYSAPIQPQEIYARISLEGEFILLGDDMMGYCLALNLASGTLGKFHHEVNGKHGHHPEISNPT